jgi:hypothetical protein
METHYGYSRARVGPVTSVGLSLTSFLHKGMTEILSGLPTKTTLALPRLPIKGTRHWISKGFELCTCRTAQSGQRILVTRQLVSLGDLERKLRSLCPFCETMLLQKEVTAFHDLSLSSLLRTNSCSEKSTLSESLKSVALPTPPTFRMCCAASSASPHWRHFGVISKPIRCR